MGPVFPLSSTAASVLRGTKGTWYRSAKAPDQPLELYGSEGSPYARIAREALCVLELPYVLKTTPGGSARWQELLERGGKRMIPYLVDPNTGTEMYESGDIKAYLFDTYAA